MHTWFVLETPSATAARGPFTLETMEQMGRSGLLRSDSLVARAGATGWTVARDDDALRALFLPYASTAPAPRASLIAEVALPAYSFGNAFSLGWATFKAHWGSLVLMVLVYLGLCLVINVPMIAGMIPLQLDPRDPSPAAVLAFVVGALITIALTIALGYAVGAGAFYTAVRAVRGEVLVSDIFTGVRRYGAVFGTSVLVLLIMLVALVIPYATFFGGVLILANASDAPVAALLGIALVVVGYIAAIAITLPLSVILMMSIVLIVDPRVNAAGGMSAINHARRMTQGNLPSLSGLLLVTGLIAGLSIYLCCVGLPLFGMPLTFAIIGASYEMLRVEDARKHPSN